jgi:hypothetical protein
LTAALTNDRILARPIRPSDSFPGEAGAVTGSGFVRAKCENSSLLRIALRRTLLVHRNETTALASEFGIWKAAMSQNQFSVVSCPTCNGSGFVWRGLAMKHETIFICQGKPAVHIHVKNLCRRNANMRIGHLHFDPNWPVG